jgi:4-hydroxy-tetrahydrodipicolinate synthase
MQFPRIKAGAAGLSCIQGNIYPELIVWICENYNNAEREGDVKLLQKFFVESMDIVHSAYPIVAKYCLQRKRFSHLYLHTSRCGRAHERLAGACDQLLDEVDRIQAELGIASVFKKALEAPLK